MTKEQLRQYRFIKQEIIILQNEIDGLRTSLTSAPQPDGMPKGNFTSDRTASTVAKIVDLEAILHKNIRALIDLRGEMEHCIEVLPADQRILMRLRYIDGLRWEAIACEMNYAWAQVHRIHGRALQDINKT